MSQPTPILDAWQVVEKNLVSMGVPQIEVAMNQSSFYSGAAAVYFQCAKLLFDPSITAEEGIARFRALRTEVKSWADAHEAISKHQQNPRR